MDDSKAAGSLKGPSLGADSQKLGILELPAVFRRLDRSESLFLTHPYCCITREKQGLCESSKFQGLPGICELFTS